MTLSPAYRIVPARTGARPHHGTRQRRLAAPGLADQAEDLAPRERERDAVHRLDDGAALPEPALPQGEVHLEIVESPAKVASRDSDMLALYESTEYADNVTAELARLDLFF